MKKRVFLQKKILFIAMPNSIHTARWLSQFKDFEEYEIHIFPSINANWHKEILQDKKLILHNYEFPKEYNYEDVSGKGLEIVSAEIEKLIDNIKPDIIHTLEMQHAGYLVLPLKLKYKNSFPLWFYSCWGSDIRYFENVDKHKERISKVLENCDALFSGDKLSIEKAKTKYNFTKPIINVPSPGGSKIKYFDQMIKYKKPSKRKIILVKGYTGWVYKLDVLIEALLLCSEELIKNKYTVKIYIPPSDKKYIKQLQDAGIKVEIFKHTQCYDDVIKFYSTARINLASSLSDGVPNSMLEGMMVGVFPIQSNAGAVSEYITNGLNGILLNPLDVNGYADAIKLIIKNDELVDNAALINKKIIEERLDYDIIKNKVRNFYNLFFKKEESVN